MFRDSRLFLGSKSRLLRQYSDRNTVFIKRTVRRHDEIPSGISYAQSVQRLHGYGYYAQSLSRLAKFPARNGHHSIGLQVIEILHESFDGIQIVFAECERPRRGRRPRIHQRHLHHVKALKSGTQIRTAVCNLNMNVRTLIQMLRVLRISAPHDGGRDNGIDFDSGHATTAVSHRTQHVDSAAGPDDREVALRTQNVRQRWWG